jgi:hypothetical protein
MTTGKFVEVGRLRNIDSRADVSRRGT